MRKELAEGFANHAPADLYQPMRLNLSNLRSQHRPTLKWLRAKLQGEG